MNSTNRKTLEAVFARPAKAGIPWSDIESLFRACGAEIVEGHGSRVGIKLNGRRAVFHRPHPQKETHKAAINDVRDFLMDAGIEP